MSVFVYRVVVILNLKFILSYIYTSAWFVYRKYVSCYIKKGMEGESMRQGLRENKSVCKNSYWCLFRNKIYMQTSYICVVHLAIANKNKIPNLIYLLFGRKFIRSLWVCFVLFCFGVFFSFISIPMCLFYCELHFYSILLRLLRHKPSWF